MSRIHWAIYHRLLSIVRYTNVHIRGYYLDNHLETTIRVKNPPLWTIPYRRSSLSSQDTQLVIEYFWKKKIKITAILSLGIRFYFMHRTYTKHFSRLVCINRIRSVSIKSSIFRYKIKSTLWILHPNTFEVNDENARCGLDLARKWCHRTPVDRLKYVPEWYHSKMKYSKSQSSNLRWKTQNNTHLSQTLLDIGTMIHI